jgi:futalosine hydrolase
VSDFDLVICFSTSVEGDGLPHTIGGRSIALLRTGVGPVNAAFALTRFLSTHRARAVVACGVGGAYPGSGLRIGDVAAASTESYGDLGADAPEGFLDMRALGFPLIGGESPIYDRLPLDFYPAPTRLPFVTCSTCTGSEERAAALCARTGGAVESMEGAAIVHVARLMGVPVGEVRGISNAVGRRERGSWRVREAAQAARATLVEWLESGAPSC